MTRNNWIILCLAYIIGLLCTNLFTISTAGFTTQQLGIAIALIGGLALTSSILFQKFSIPSKIWLGAAIVAVLALFYLQLRIPQPSNKDISYQVASTQGEVVEITGKVLTPPRLNQSRKIRFVLETLEMKNGEDITGKLYVSIPLLQGTGIDLGEEITVKGILYTPSTAVGDGFDFKAYLARQGIFTGMQGLEVISDYDSEPIWGWWKIRRRIVRSHLQGLGSPLGQLVSSMVLGRKAVDLPVDIRDRFIEAGLAHVFAASGFHVSLLLGLILKLTNRLAAKPRFIAGICTLIIYLGLTGIQASVLRACLMGAAVLLAMVMDTKVKPLGSLLLVGTLILLFNPLLISDLGFQLSFLATFGLIATMPGLQAKLDWLPPTIATLIAVPLAASIWVLPLLCYEFNVVATYSIIVNILCTPLIMVISLGGMISAIASLIHPFAGSAIAWLLLYPTKLLVTAIDFFTSLPGSSWAIGQISLGVLLTIYGLLILIWLNPRLSQYWRLISIFTLTLIILPIGYRQLNLTQITVLPTQPEPAIIIQDRGKVVLVNSGKLKDFQYIVRPFLTQQGINHLDYYIDLKPKSQSDLQLISDSISINEIILPLDNPSSDETGLDCQIVTHTLSISCDRQLPILTLETPTKKWSILGKTKTSKSKILEHIKRQNSSIKPIVLVGSSIPSSWLQLNPQHIISASAFPEITRQNINQQKFYNLKQDGIVTWTPEKKLNQPQQQKSFNSIF